MITGHHNYDNGYISLVNISLDNLPDTISVSGYMLLRKTEFHISLICAKKVAPLIDEDNEDKVEAEIVGKFKEFVTQRPLNDFDLLPNLRFVERDERKTLIVMASMPHLDKFFESLSNDYGVNLPVQPAHITLYTLQPETGIGLLSNEELEQYSASVEVSELQDLRVV
jgi:hypothetical protein